MNTISIVGFILIILVLGALINTLATGAVRLVAFSVLGIIAAILLSNAVRNPSATFSFPRIPNFFRVGQQTQTAPSPTVAGGEATTPAGETPVQEAPADVGGPAGVGDEASYPTDPSGSFPQTPTSQPQSVQAAPAQTPVRGLW